MPKSKYIAPALDKGLRILKFLADTPAGATSAEIAEALGHSKPELYRMLVALERYNYIRRDELHGGYVATARMFELGLRNAERHRLLGAALPILQSLSRATGQSCHVNVISREEIVVVLRVESETSIGFSVKVGLRVPALEGTSSRVFFAFSSRLRQAEWLRFLRSQSDRQATRRFLHEAAAARAQGYLRRSSVSADGVVDIVSPILADAKPLATLVVPFMEHVHNPASEDEVIQATRSAAEQISQMLSGLRTA